MRKLRWVNKSKLMLRTWGERAERHAKRLQKRAKRFQKALHPYRAYIALTLVTIGVAFGTVDRIRRQTESRRDESRPSLSIFDSGPVETPVSNPLSAEPWSFFRPAWGTQTRGILFPVSSSFPPSEDMPVDVATLLDDPKNRVEDDFSVPTYLRDRVRFWMQVHAVYNSRMRVVHDRNNLAIVYGFLDFRPLFRAMGPGVATEVRANQIERQVLKELQARISEAAELTSTDKLTASERASLRDFLSSFGALGTAQAQKLVANLRTQTGQSDEFLSALHRSKQLLPHIETVFRRAGLPVALGRIPFVESSFHLRAASKVGAVGIWQFMPETARQMISADSSKWADPLRQTQAATRLLKIFRGLLPDWSTAVTSYNSGVGRLQRLVRKHRAKDLGPILEADDDDGLGFAGKNFYAQFLSANLVEAYKEEIFHRLLNPADAVLVLKGLDPLPIEKCDL